MTGVYGNRVMDALHEAQLQALESKGVGENKFRLGACVFNSRTYVAAANMDKTHPLLKKFYKYPYLHAESHAIIKRGLDNCEGDSIMVVRLRKDNSLTMAKPCDNCIALIKHVGIRHVYYTNWEGVIEHLILGSGS